MENTHLPKGYAENLDKYVTFIQAAEKAINKEVKRVVEFECPICGKMAVARIEGNEHIHAACPHCETAVHQ